MKTANNQENLSLFDLPCDKFTESKKKPFIPSQHWSVRLKELEISSKAQKRIEADYTFEKYHSGASNKAEMLGYIEAKKNIGVCALDLSKPAIDRIKSYLQSGGKVMVDSGAFRLFKRDLKLQQHNSLDFEKVMSVYFEIAQECTTPENLMVVAPDVVGDQIASLDTLSRYVTQVNALSNMGVRVMLPLQKGTHSLHHHYEECVSLLGSDKFVIGLPSNAKAISTEDVIEFLSTAQPRRVHFLGVTDCESVHRAMYLLPESEISTDATQFRKEIGSNGLITRMCEEKTDESVINAVTHGNPGCAYKDYDETEVLGDITGFYKALNKHEQLLFRKEFGLSPSDVIACDNEQLWEAIDTHTYGYGEHRLSGFLFMLARKEISPQVRKDVITELAKSDII